MLTIMYDIYYIIGPDMEITNATKKAVWVYSYVCMLAITKEFCHAPQARHCLWFMIVLLVPYVRYHRSSVSYSLELHEGWSLSSDWQHRLWGIHGRHSTHYHHPPIVVAQLTEVGHCHALFILE